MVRPTPLPSCRCLALPHRRCLEVHVSLPDSPPWEGPLTGPSAWLPWPHASYNGV